MDTSGQALPFKIWQTSGVTEHLGGYHATRRLIKLCGAVLGMQVLDIGCGTGYTAYLLAREAQARVTAIDLSSRSVQQARARIVKEHITDQVSILQADAHRLPFQAGRFDLVLVESVLVFCRLREVLGEIQRVLKPGGSFGANEMTMLKPPVVELVDLLENMMGIVTFQEDEWREHLRQAGFTEIKSVVRRFNLWEQFISHLKVDGVKAYFSALSTGLSDPKLSGPFLNKRILKAALQFMPFIGYGLYSARKPTIE